MSYYAVTGTIHGSIVFANSESEARKLFLRVYNGEPIISVRPVSSWCF